MDDMTQSGDVKYLLNFDIRNLAKLYALGEKDKARERRQIRT